MSYAIRMDAQPEYAMLMRSLTTFRDSVGFHLMDEAPLPDDLAKPLWQAFHLVHGAIDKLAAEYDCDEGLDAIFALSPPNAPDPGDGS